MVSVWITSMVTIDDRHVDISSRRNGLK